jgi:large subunit ribosomal protein L14e
MTFTKFVEIGRVAKVNMGADEGKLVTVLDVVNQNRVLVEGENVQRMVIPVRRLSLTKFKINDVLRN